MSPRHHLGDRLVFWVCSALLLILVCEGVYKLGRTHGVTSVSPCRPIKAAYDMDRKQLRRWVRYEQAKGEKL